MVRLPLPISELVCITSLVPLPSFAPECKGDSYRPYGKNTARVQQFPENRSGSVCYIYLKSPTCRNLPLATKAGLREF